MIGIPNENFKPFLVNLWLERNDSRVPIGKETIAKIIVCNFQLK